MPAVGQTANNYDTFVLQEGFLDVRSLLAHSAFTLSVPGMVKTEQSHGFVRWHAGEYIQRTAYDRDHDQQSPAWWGSGAFQGVAEL